MESRSRVSLRAEVVAAAREMLRLGLVVGTAGNVSAREGGGMLITPAAMAYEDMTEDDLVTLPAGGPREPSSEWRVHDAIYAARPEGRCDRPHPQHPRHGVELPGRAARHPHQGVHAGTRRRGGDRGRRSARVRRAGRQRSCRGGDRNGALLYRHGVLALGDSPARALVVAQVIERHARMAWLLRR